MAGNDIVIVNERATREAITQFETVKKQLGVLEGNLQSNAEKLKGAWKGLASDDYYTKTKRFIDQINKAEVLLEARIRDIDAKISKEVQADIEARSQANSIPTLDI